MLFGCCCRVLLLLLGVIVGVVVVMEVGSSWNFWEHLDSGSICCPVEDQLWMKDDILDIGLPHLELPMHLAYT